jgi:hypothetical protein
MTRENYLHNVQMEATQFFLFDISNFERVIQRTQTVELKQKHDDNSDELQYSSSLIQMSPARELQSGEYTHPDYNKVIQLFEQISNLTHDNQFTDNFSREEWFSILGSWQSVGNCIRAKCDYIRRHESDREGAITVDALV